MLRAARISLFPLFMLSACQVSPPSVLSVVSPEEPALEGWRAVALREDRERLDGLAAAWEQALAEVRSRGLAARIRAEGAVLEPAAGLPRAALAPGPYRCRLIRFGAGRRALIVYPLHFCHVGVEGELLSLTKQSGSERPGGYLWSDGDGQSVFLGAIALGGEPVPPPYGDDPTRDVIGLAERIGPFHYRVAIPWPRSGAMLDILELVAFVPAEG